MYASGSYMELRNIIDNSINNGVDYTMFLKGGEVYGLTKKELPFYLKTELRFANSSIVSNEGLKELRILLDAAKNSYDKKSEEKFLPLYTGNVVTLTPKGVVFDHNTDYESEFFFNSRVPDEDLVRTIKVFLQVEHSVKNKSGGRVNSMIPTSVNNIIGGLKKVSKEVGKKFIYSKEDMIMMCRKGRIYFLHKDTSKLIHEFKREEVISSNFDMEVEMDLNYYERIMKIKRMTNSERIDFCKVEDGLYIEMIGKDDIMLYRGKLKTHI